MPAWPEVRRYIEERYAVAGGSAEHLELIWTFPQSGPEPVRQRQRVGLVAARGRAQLIIVCEVAPLAGVGLDAAMRHNMSLAVGALALLDESVVLRCCRGLDHLDVNELDVLLETTAHEAARLRIGQFGRPELDDLVSAVAHWT